ncbi:MAG: Fic family protein [Bacteroidota bacterium]|nr:Fic family protein [Bacteroidota bacterium]
MILSEIKNIDKLKEQLNSLRPFDPIHEKRIWQKFRLDWNYHSNNIEGNQLSYGETKALILFNITASGKPLRDHFEISGHNEAVEWILDIVKEDRPLTQNFIRELHKLILKEPYEKKAISPDGNLIVRKIEIGVYKNQPNHVLLPSGEIFYFASPEETPAKMHDLLEWYLNEKSKKVLHPLILAAEFHYKFIRIHPFDDGNGRTARILMNFILMQYGFPPVIIKTGEKENYFAALRQADAGVLEPFVNFIGLNLKNSLELMLKAVKGESIEDEDDVDKEIRLLEQKSQKIFQRIGPEKTLEFQLEILKSIIHTQNQVLNLFSKYKKFFKKFWWHSQGQLESNETFDFNDKKTDQLMKSESLTKIIVQYIFQHFFSIEDNSTIIFDLRITFNTLNYQIRDDKNELLLSKLYNETLTNEDNIFLVHHFHNRLKSLIDSKLNENDPNSLTQ